MTASFSNNKSKPNIYVVANLFIDETVEVYNSSLDVAIKEANEEWIQYVEKLQENIETINKLTPDCDKLDYGLAASIGALSGVIDIFLVDKPTTSTIGKKTDEWVENRVKDFAKMTNWNYRQNDSIESAIRHLETKFKVTYDQTGLDELGSTIDGLTPRNHHFMSLAHNPSLLGMIFSVLNQFNYTSDFVTNGTVEKLRDIPGNEVPANIFFGIKNWLGHLMSDVAGTSGKKGRGAGIPSPLWTWTNDVIVLKEQLNIPTSEFDKTVNYLARKIYERGYDTRFQLAQSVPVFVNETLVRLVYSIRRLIQYFAKFGTDNVDLQRVWNYCEPFSNSSVKRMLTVAHGTFCAVDIGDALAHSASKSKVPLLAVKEFLLRLNIIGVGRFTISLYGEAYRGVQLYYANEEHYFLERKKKILEDYIDSLHALEEKFDDKKLLMFMDDLSRGNVDIDTLKQSAQLAEKRGVSEKNRFSSMDDIDAFFMKGKNDVEKN